MKDIRVDVTWLRDDDNGEVIDVNASPKETIKVGLPKVPPHEEILFHDLPQKKQYWRVQPIPKGLNRDTQQDYMWFINRELDRIEDGIWFYNDGEPTYITGEHYYYINYVKLDVGSPDYRDRDRRYFYIWEVVKKHSMLRGIVLVKPRRMGASYIGSSKLLYKITRTKNALGGIVSKTGTDAKEFFTEKLVPAFQELPFFLQPLTSSGSDPKSALVFSKPRESGKKVAKEGIDTSVGLNSKIDWRNTKERSYDSMKLTMLVFDESGKLEGKQGKDGKWIGINLPKMWGVLSKTLGLKKKVGHAFLPSTVDDLTAGGAQFKELFEGSLLQNLNENGTTPSGLLGVFISADDGLEGFVDMYGRSVIEDPEKPIKGVDGDWITQGSLTYINNERKGKISEADYIEYCREMPLTIEEAFYNKASDSIFNLVRIQNQIKYIESEHLDRHLLTGRFQWVGGKRDGTVEFVPDPSGKVIVSYLPNVKDANKFKWHNGKKAPVNDRDFAGGVDSYDINSTSDGKGSNGAMVIYCKPSSNPDIPEKHKNSFIFTYDSREKYAELFYEQVLMASVYYSTPILVENNKPRILHYFASRGYKEYLAFRPDKNPRDLTRNEKELRGIPSNEETIIAQAEDLQYYISEFVGEMKDGSMGKIRQLNLLYDWFKFRIDKRTPYDLSVASGLAYTLARKMARKLTVPKGFGKSMFRKYNYKGGKSIGKLIK